MAQPTESFRAENVNEDFIVELDGQKYHGCANVLQFTWDNTEGDESSEDGIYEFFIDEAEIQDEIGNMITGELFDKLIALIPESMVKRWCEYQYEKIEAERQSRRY